jgi:hypothetical protein
VPLAVVAIASAAASCGLVFPLSPPPPPDADADPARAPPDAAPPATDADLPATDAAADAETDAAGPGPIDALDAHLKASNTQEVDRFGQRVALSADGGVLAVGAAGEDSAAVGNGGDQASNLSAESGAAYLYR